MSSEEEGDDGYDGPLSKDERAWLDENTDMEALYLEPRKYYDHAITAIGNQPCKGQVLVYDAQKVIEATIQMFREAYPERSEEGLWSAAVEWCDYNTFCAYAGEGTPIFTQPFPPDDLT